jgi:hypothetical protein
MEMITEEIILVDKPERKKTFWGSRRRRTDDIKINLRKTAHENTD